MVTELDSQVNSVVGAQSFSRIISLNMSWPTGCCTVDSTQLFKPCNLVCILSLLHVAARKKQALPIMEKRGAFHIRSHEF